MSQVPPGNSGPPRRRQEWPVFQDLLLRCFEVGLLALLGGAPGSSGGWGPKEASRLGPRSPPGLAFSNFKEPLDPLVLRRCQLKILSGHPENKRNLTGQREKKHQQLPVDRTKNVFNMFSTFAGIGFHPCETWLPAYPESVGCPHLRELWISGCAELPRTAHMTGRGPS